MVTLDYMYKKYYNYIRAIVARLINNDPDDIAQMSFYKLSKLEYYDEQHGKAFLIKVAKNMCIDYLRKQKRERMNTNRMALDLDMYTEPFTEGEQQAADLAQVHTDVIEFIHQEIKKLPATTRTVFELYLSDMELRDIAEHMKIKYQTVLNHLQTARTHLKVEVLFNKKDALQLLAGRPKI